MSGWKTLDDWSPGRMYADGAQVLSLYALRRDLHYAQQGTTDKPQPANQSEQA